MIITEEQRLLKDLYNLEESLNGILLNHKMYEEIRSLHLIIEKLEYKIINTVGSIGI
jgi:hypothetical protein